MKRLGALLLSLCLVITAVAVLISCGGDDVTTTPLTTTTPKATTTTTTLRKITTTTPDPNKPENPDENTILLATKEDITAFLNASTTYEGKTIKLTADIVLNDTSDPEWYKKADVYEWKSLKNFTGTFDGQGHTITGVYLNYGSLTTVPQFCGMFEKTNGAKFLNIGLIDAYAYVRMDVPFDDSIGLEQQQVERCHFGLLSGCADGGITIENCFASVNLDLDGMKNCGILSGWHNGNGSIKNNVTSGTMTCAMGGAIINGGAGAFENNFSSAKVIQSLPEIMEARAEKDQWALKVNLFGNIGKGAILDGCIGILGQYAVDPETNKPYLSPLFPDNASNSGYYEKSALLGDAAKDVMTTYDFEDVWQTNANGLPSLKIFGNKCIPTV